MSEDKGLRFNTNKARYDLIEPFALEELVKVFTRGANKYADRNWEKGMKWSTMLASMKRHVAAFENGEDFDFDPNCETCKTGNCVNHTGLYHMAHAAWNCMALVSYYKMYPQGDNRRHSYLSGPKVGLDIDEVLADWVGHWTKHHKMEVPETWNFDKDIKSKFDKLKDNKAFWLSIPTKMNPKDLPFEPHCYITSRSIPKEWTEEWIQKSGFPTMPVYSVGLGESKIEVAKKSGIDIFVDDRYENFVELNNAGICTFLYTAPHNLRYDVGHKRIKSLYDLPFLK